MSPWGWGKRSFLSNPRLCHCSSLGGLLRASAPKHLLPTCLQPLATCRTRPWHVYWEMRWNSFLYMVQDRWRSPSNEGHHGKKKGLGEGPEPSPCPLLCLAAFANGCVAAPAKDTPQSLAFSPFLAGSL